MTSLAGQYLVEIDGQNREDETLRRFCHQPFMLDDLLAVLEIPAGFYWVLLGVQHEELVASRAGDVDLIAGRMSVENHEALQVLREKHERTNPRWPALQHAHFAALELAASGGLKWPPPLDYVVAVEAKCSYFDFNTSRVMSQKSSSSKVRNMRTQIGELLEILPFNRIALLDFIVNPPATGQDGQAWLSAAATALDSLHDMTPALQNRLPADSPAGQFVMSWGAVAGGTEYWRGTGGPLLLRPAIENPRLIEPEVQARRHELEGNLRRLLVQRQKPSWFPAILD